MKRIDDFRSKLVTGAGINMVINMLIALVIKILYDLQVLHYGYMIVAGTMVVYSMLVLGAAIYVADKLKVIDKERRMRIRGKRDKDLNKKLNRAI